MENEIVLYQPSESIKLDVRVEGETVWLTQEHKQSTIILMLYCQSDIG